MKYTESHKRCTFFPLMMEIMAWMPLYRKRRRASTVCVGALYLFPVADVPRTHPPSLPSPGASCLPRIGFLVLYEIDAHQI